MILFSSSSILVEIILAFSEWGHKNGVYLEHSTEQE
jgi:hypothetical protein